MHLSQFMSKSHKQTASDMLSSIPSLQGVVKNQGAARDYRMEPNHTGPSMSNKFILIGLKGFSKLSQLIKIAQDSNIASKFVEADFRTTTFFAIGRNAYRNYRKESGAASQKSKRKQLPRRENKSWMIQRVAFTCISLDKGPSPIDSRHLNRPQTCRIPNLTNLQQKEMKVKPVNLTEQSYTGRNTESIEEGVVGIMQATPVTTREKELHLQVTQLQQSTGISALAAA
ncbi:hypothetical protein KIW84_053879 [Lathyrus oleraceus]|uniref:Uncharacterized protein n=1 Tax=Pisum sativum TaxID=3888 RepID=A0A9D4WTX3_PEA|nr:hypothetical protein KIW84_053879 [Pisum sativum]